MDALNVINLFSAATSIVLAAVALWLSIYFFRQSSTQAHQAETSASQIAASVDRLEKIFNTLYSDTFSMMRETVTDMRAHIWARVDNEGFSPGGVLAQADNVAAAKIEATRQQLISRISSISKHLGLPEEQVGGMLQELVPAIGKALDESSDAGAERIAKANFVLSTLRSYLASSERASLSQRYADVVLAMQKFGFTTEDTRQSLLRGRAEGWVTWSGPADTLDHEGVVRLQRT